MWGFVWLLYGKSALIQGKMFTESDKNSGVSHELLASHANVFKSSGGYPANHQMLRWPSAVCTHTSVLSSYRIL